MESIGKYSDKALSYMWAYKKRLAAHMSPTNRLETRTHMGCIPAHYGYHIDHDVEKTLLMFIQVDVILQFVFLLIFQISSFLQPVFLWLYQSSTGFGLEPWCRS